MLIEWANEDWDTLFSETMVNNVCGEIGLEYEKESEKLLVSKEVYDNVLAKHDVYLTEEVYEHGVYEHDDGFLVRFRFKDRPAIYLLDPTGAGGWSRTDNDEIEYVTKDKWLKELSKIRKDSYSITFSDVTREIEFCSFSTIASR